MAVHSVRTAALAHGRVTQCGGRAESFPSLFAEVGKQAQQSHITIYSKGTANGETGDPKSMQICRFSLLRASRLEE